MGTSTTRSYLLSSSSDTAEPKSPVGEDEVFTARPGIHSTLYNMERKSNILTVYFELTIVLFCDVVELMGIFAFKLN